MAYTFVTAKKLLKDASEKAMENLALAESYLHSGEANRAESFTEIGEAYAKVAHAAADALEEVA